VIRCAHGQGKYARDWEVLAFAPGFDIDIDVIVVAP
jgi:hypothetical protein